jgi:hypothetical protein
MRVYLRIFQQLKEKQVKLIGLLHFRFNEEFQIYSCYYKNNFSLIFQ